MADYRKMWSDLGMDLEKHDLLCELYPIAFELYICPRKTVPKEWIFNFVVSEIHGVRPAELIEHQKMVVKYLVLSVYMYLTT